MLKEKVSLDKKYKTASGYDVKILSVDRKSYPYAVVALVEINGEDSIVAYTSYGESHLQEPNKRLNLVESTSYDYLKDGDLCLVWDKDQKFVRTYKGNGLFGLENNVLGSNGYTWDNYKKLGVNVNDFIND